MARAAGAAVERADPARDVDPDSAWQAVLARDRAADGQFVYAVRSTGIYCRPVCPSRRPRRAQVAFFGHPAAAQRAGFRPCRRCRPHGDGISDVEQRVARARAYLDGRAGERVALGDLAAEVGLSPGHLQRNFKRIVGVSPQEYGAAQRLERFQGRLRAGADVASAGYGAGYGSGSRVYEQAAPRLGMSPGRYRRGGAGLHVRFATAGTALGRLLVAATERGVCAVSLGRNDAELLAALQHEYPRAELLPDRAAVRPWLDAVRARLEPGAGGAQGPPEAPPLDVAGTAFQWRVWRALQAIPHGETRTYAEIAASLGRPAAARAVARACASNQVALLVPCHRVVPAAGGVGGYRWGTQRKQRLLELENRRTGRRDEA